MNEEREKTIEEAETLHSSSLIAQGALNLTSDLGDVPADEFRRLLHEVADRIADYRASISTQRIIPESEPGATTRQLPEAPPEHAEEMTEVLRDFDRIIMPGLVHWGHPMFLGYFATTTTAPGIIGEMIAAALNVSAMTWATSPAATELESVVLDWIRQMLGLPAEFEGVVYDTASVALLHALAAAREDLNLNVRHAGLAGRTDIPPLTLYASDQAHSSLRKAAITLGIGEANVRGIRTDAEFRMDAAELRRQLADDVRAGLRPLAVVATVGTTSATSVDPTEEIARVCREYRTWLHVDAAYGGAMALIEEGRWVMRGVELADSVVFNPHKWMYVPLDFSALYVRRIETLSRVFSLVPEYLRGDAEKAGEAARNYMDYGIQLGRRFRALKAWMVIRTFGREGLARRIQECCRLARLFVEWIESDDRFELLAPVTMAVVCFRVRLHATDEVDMEAELNKLNEKLLNRVNSTGEVYLTHTQLKGKLALRIAIGNVNTATHHLHRLHELLGDKLTEIQSGK